MNNTKELCGRVNQQMQLAGQEIGFARLVGDNLDAGGTEGWLERINDAIADVQVRAWHSLAVELGLRMHDVRAEYLHNYRSYRETQA